MPSPAEPAPCPRNRLLAALPADGLAWPRPEAVEPGQRRILHGPGKPIAAAHLPETGWVSMLSGLGSGDAAEVGLTGREGMAGLPLLLGSDRGLLEAAAAIWSGARTPACRAGRRADRPAGVRNRTAAPTGRE